MNLLAQLPDSLIGPLVQTGGFGVVVAWFMFQAAKDREERAREAEKDREERATERSDRNERYKELNQESRLQRRSIDDLIRMIGIEILSRPSIQAHAARDAKELLDAVKSRSEIER